MAGIHINAVKGSSSGSGGQAYTVYQVTRHHIDKGGGAIVVYTNGIRSIGSVRAGERLDNIAGHNLYASARARHLDTQQRSAGGSIGIDGGRYKIGNGVTRDDVDTAGTYNTPELTDAGDSRIIIKAGNNI